MKPLFFLLFSFSIALSQETYYPPKLFVEISSNIQVGVKRQGQTKTYVNYRIENNTGASNTHTNSYTDSYIKDVTKERIRKTNEDYYKSRPQASSLFGGIARAFAGDYTGLLDFGGNVVDHMMTPKYRVFETSTYKTTEKFERTNSSATTGYTTVKNDLIQQITQESTVDANAGFIRFSIRMYNDAQKGVRIKNPQFVLYFRMRDGSREIISFENATAGSDDLHWLPSKSHKDFEINVDSLNVERLFSNYLNSEEIELNLNNLQIKIGEEFYAAGEIEERYEEQGVRVKYYNGQDTREFFALINDTRPTVGELIELYLNEQQVGFNSDPESSNIVDAINKISVNQNRHSEKKLNQINGQELIEWRKWIVTVYDQNNVIIPFSVTDTLKPGYKISLSFFSGKDMMGEHYMPVIFTKNDIVLTADGNFKLDVDLKKGDELVIENVRLNRLYTDMINYSITPVTIPDNSPLISGIYLQKTEAQLFLDEQKSIEDVHYPPSFMAPYSFRFDTDTGNSVKYYWFRPVQVNRQVYFKPEDYIFLRWYKGNSDIDAVIDEISEQTQQSFIAAFIMSHLYNSFDPTITLGRPSDYGLIQHEGSIFINDNNNTPEVNTIIRYLNSEGGLEKIRDSISKISQIHYILPGNIDRNVNVWQSSMKRNSYYSFLSAGTQPMPNAGKYRSLSTGRQAIRYCLTVDTRSAFSPPLIQRPAAGLYPPLGLGIPPYGYGLLSKERIYSVETLVRLDEQQPAISPIHRDMRSLGLQDNTLKGNKEIFEISFDVKIIRR